MDLAFEIETEALVQVLDTLDYFQVLKVPQTATPADIKAAFYRESRAYHPDRYHAMPPCAVKEHAGRIYKRVTEAYVTLRDDRKRAKYLQDINGPDREARLRFDEEAEKETKAEQKKQIEEQFGQTLKGRQLFQQALKDLEGGRAEAAVRNLKLALGFEPANEKFKEQLRLAEKKIVRDFRIK
ncbi:MAG TPA: DnaJ domain-containing protein [Myxococcales bacterium]|jgi:DnaJ-class molecular chaperone|nr:DnaJ domain-containing protein [Myxococcales bacterium]